MAGGSGGVTPPRHRKARANADVLRKWLSLMRNRVSRAALWRVTGHDAP